MDKINVGILGATGLVGQRLVRLLLNHPWFQITDLVASDASAGKYYQEACKWLSDFDMPEQIKRSRIKTINTALNARILFSALSSKIAETLEDEYARKNHVVVSNVSNSRLDKDVPLVIPEVNPEHLQIIEHQRLHRHFDRGFIIKNPNCVSIPLSIVLTPLHKQWGVEKVFVTTHQAISGAGFSGITALEIFDNVVPFIKGEEQKIEKESKKILGDYQNDGIIDCEIVISAQVNRVAVVDGHLASVAVKLTNKAELSDVEHSLTHFTALPQTLNLPSAPSRPLVLRKEEDRPQPRLDRNTEKGMAVIVGRVRKCPIFDIKFTILSHNIVRGAAGAAVLNAELLKAQGYI